MKLYPNGNLRILWYFATAKNTIIFSNCRLGRASCKPEVHSIFCSLHEMHVRAVATRVGGGGSCLPWICQARQIKSVDGFYNDLQLFAIFIFEVDFSETHLMTSAGNSVSKPPNLKIFWGRIPPVPLYKALAFGTRDNSLVVTKNLATALHV